MTTIRSASTLAAAPALNDDGPLLPLASDAPAASVRTPSSVTSLRSDHAIVIPETLTRTKTGFGVRVELLVTSQKKFYDRLTADRFTPAQINEIVTVFVRGGVDGLAGKYSRLSIDNLACLSHLVNNLNAETAPHDAAHMLLGNRSKTAYGVSEYAENVGNALGNNFLGRPQGLYEGFRVDKNESGGLTVAAMPGTREQVKKVFALTADGSRVIDSNFQKTFLANSKERVWLAANEAMSSSDLPFEARFAKFYRELEANGQLPVKGNPELTTTLKKNYARLEDSVAGQTPSELRTNIVTYGTDLISETLALEATKVFKSMPDAKRFEFFADFIAMVVAMNNQSPNQISLPNKTTGTKLFKTEWTDLNTHSVDDLTGKMPLAAPGFLRDFLDIRNQVRKLLGVPVAPVAVPLPTAQGSTTPNQKPNGTEAMGTSPGTTTTTSRSGTAPTTTTLPPKTNKGGYVQRPDAPEPRPIEKPLTFPLTPPKKAGPLHAPSRRPDPDPRSGLFTSPKSEPGKPRHTGNTSPRPKLDPNPPPFPNTSNVPDDRLPNKLPAPTGSKTKPPNKAPTPTSSEFTWSPSRLKTKPTRGPITSDRVDPLPTPPRTEYSWSQTRVNPNPTRAPSAATRPQSRGIVGSHDQLRALQKELGKLPANAAPTLEHAQMVMTRMKADIKNFITAATEVIKSLPSHLQSFALAQLGQLRAAWDRWSPGALKNLESFGQGAGDALRLALSLLAGIGATLETIQKIGA